MKGYGGFHEVGRFLVSFFKDFFSKALVTFHRA